MTSHADYLEQLSPDNAAVLFIEDMNAAKAIMPQMMKWIGAFTPAPSIISMSGAYEEG